MLKPLSRRQKQAVAVAFDTFTICFAIWAALSLRYGELHQFSNVQVIMLLMAVGIAIPVFITLGMYRAVIRYVSFKALWTVFKAVTIFSLLWGSLAIFFKFGIPRSTPVIVWALLIIMIGGTRMIGRWYFAYLLAQSAGVGACVKVLVYGAGDAGVQLIRALSYAKDMDPIAFIDDDPAMVDTIIQGYRVHAPTRLDKLISSFGIDEILLAIPSASISRRREIIGSLERYPVLVRSLPGIDALAKGTISINDIREIDLEDLLGRDSVQPDIKLLQRNIKDKVVMVTGAGGSIGSELCRQIIKQSPSQIILFEQHEYSLYELGEELHESNIDCVKVLGSVTNLGYIREIIGSYGVQTIYHAAAYKHVPMVEWNPAMGVLTNVFGTLRLAQAAVENSVETFVLISTDKAVRPTNIMGASKRLAEMILQAYAGKGSDIRFTMVRFGNVIGSSGSVVPLFRAQIKQGGPVTVTHPEITRFFMTIPEAVQLVIQAGSLGEGGDVFVLDMGQPVKIKDLAERMIRLSGFSAKNTEMDDGDIEIEYSGLRPGEKLYEELLIGENVEKTAHKSIMRANETFLELDDLLVILDGLRYVVEQNDSTGIVEMLSQSVEGYRPDERMHAA